MRNRRPRSRPSLKLRLRSLCVAAAAVAAALCVDPTETALAQEVDPRAILKSMSDYLASQQTISAKLNTSIEVITPELEKIQFDSSIALQVKRPNKLKAERVGGYAAVELVFDGATLTVHDKDGKKFSQVPAGGSLDDLIDIMREKLAISAPGADLLHSDVYTTLNADILTAKYIGLGVIDDVECEHLAFRNAETDWQLWVKTGAEPIPCKMVITSKTLAGAPQYTLDIREWASGGSIDDQTFAFQPDAATVKVDLNEMSGLDEVPPPAGAEEGAQQ